MVRIEKVAREEATPIGFIPDAMHLIVVNVK
jgi:hypothetical protein